MRFFRSLHRSPGMAACLLLVGLCIAANAGASVATDKTGKASAATDATTAALDDSGQLILVIAPDWDSDHGRLQAFERDGSGTGWAAHGDAFAVVLGRAGSAWGIGLHPAMSGGPIKREGDGRSPAGIFSIGEAFGYADSADTAMPYRAMHSSDYCIDAADSSLYNRIVDADVVGEEAVKDSTEPMRRDLHLQGDAQYRQGFVVAHNPLNLPGAGSCIFAHLWKAPGNATAGCTAMAPTAMRDLLGWLRPQRQPLFVLLPQAEYLRLKERWRLPDVSKAGQ